MKYFFNIFFMALVFSCGTERKEEVITNENFGPILTPYLAIVDALINDDFNQVREAGEKMSDANKDTGVELALVRMGQLISDASSLYDQHSILEQLGMVMQLYIEQEVINDYPIYKFKCKNEFDGKEVFWYGLSKKSSNPFIGSNSNECVELIETIKPVIKK